jgi:hypothetical protein
VRERERERNSERSKGINREKWREHEVLGRINRLLSLIRHGPHWRRRVQKFFYCCVCIVNEVTFLSSRCLATIRGLFTEPLPSNNKGIFTEPLPSNHKGIVHRAVA